MANAEGSTNISINVTKVYAAKHSGARIKYLLSNFFNEYLVEKCKQNQVLLDLVLAYPDFDELADILEGFRHVAKGSQKPQA